jgi:hypothetical protein
MRCYFFLICAATCSIALAQQPAALTPVQLQNFESLADQVKVALQAGDLANANKLASDLLLGIFKARKTMEPNAQQKYQALLQILTNGPQKGFYDLANLANAALDANELDAAESFAKELLQKFSTDAHGRGTAIFVGHNVLGRVALHRDKDPVRAQSELLLASSTPGSPTLGSFGPNMTLAKELLEQGERQTVLEFLTRCRTFWKMGSERLDAWTAMVKGGGMPAFGPNLAY